MRRKRFPLFLVGALAVLIVLASGCGGIVQSGTGSNSGGFHLASYIQNDVKSHKRLVIRVDYHDTSLGFAVPIRQGVEQAARDLNVDAQLIGPANGSAADQVAELQTLITQQRVDALAVSSASSDALKPVFADAYNAGIPIISFNTDNPGSKQMAFVGQNLVESGTVEAQQLLKLLNGRKGKVVVFSVDTGAGWSHDRFSGFQTGLGSNSGLQIVGPVNTGNEPSQAYNVVQNTMAANPDAIALVSLDCCSLDAAASWVQQAHKAGQVTVIGFDLLPQTKTYIENGVVQATISQNPVQQGYQAVKILYDFLVNNVPLHNFNTGTVLIMRDNVNSIPVEG
jgi:simple sugar transport system substrate-binding protein